MIAAFKGIAGTIHPFKYVVVARKEENTILKIKYLGESTYFEFYCSSGEDRDQQLANFEKWLTIKTNSI